MCRREGLSGEALEKNECAYRARRVGGFISLGYLLFFVLFEVYSAAATALDRSSEFPTWEHFLGWALFILPCALVVSIVLLHGRHPKLGFALLVGNLCLYASFMVFESVIYDGAPASRQAVWEVGGIWAVLFLAAILAARFLAVETQTHPSSSE
jgi:cytochrome bd-type quinol oxidase subunit 2